MKAHLAKLVAKTQELRNEMMFGEVSKLDTADVHPLTVQHLLLAAASLDAVHAHLRIARFHVPPRRPRKGRRA